MKFILFGLGLLSIVVGQRLSFNDSQCNVYTEKFGTTNSADGTGASKIAFQGDAAFVPNSTNVTVTLRYQDNEFFNNQTFWGLTKEDGKPLASTCLDFNLSKYPSNAYSSSQKVNVTDLPITANSDFQKQWRSYSFTIPGNQLETRLVKTQNSNQFVYKGYYSLAFYAAGTSEVQYTFFFEFTVSIDKSSGASVDTSFKPLSQTQQLTCTTGGVCTAKADTTLQWCSDPTCNQKLVTPPDLRLNDQFVLLQTVTTKGMDAFYLTATEVWYTGNGLNKKATKSTFNNSVKGQVIITAKAEIAWSKVTIKVTSVLSDLQAGGRRLLVQTEYNPVTGETDNIECIKAEGKETCATCEEECQINGYSREGCPSCDTVTSSFSQQIAIVFLALLLVFGL